MSKLLSANFFRLKRDKIFWIVSAAMLVLSAFSMINNGITAQKYADQNIENNVTALESCYFNLMPMIGFFFSVFISLFLGTEYSEGTIRNKLISGHTRTDIYLSNYVICLVGTEFIYVLFLIAGLVGIPFFGIWKAPISQIIIYIIIGFFITASLTAILNMLSMLSTNKAATAVLSIVLAFALMIIASSIYNVLAEPETTAEFISMSADGKVEFGDEIPNPAYVFGLERKIDEWLVQFLPTGQGILAANSEISQPVLNIVYSIIIAAIVNIAGIFAFRKKDLK